MASYDDDGPSDEGEAASQPSYQYPEEDEDEDQYVEEEEEDAPMPPPPPPPPRNRRSRGRDRGRAPQYPTTIEVAAPRSRIASRAKQRARSAHSHPHSYDYDSNAGYSVGDEGSAPGVIEPLKQNYESFPAPSVNNSLLESSMDNTMEESHARSIEESSLPMPSKKASRGQVLVHYHPQLGDEGYESTLLDSASREDKYSKVSRAMAAATDGSAARGPPKHIYPTNRGMHTRAIDEMREEEMNHSPGRRIQSQLAGGNDEYNNAATRQIRRRVFRVALERGIHDERRKKMLDADMDVGGPSLKIDTGKGETSMSNGDAGISPLGLASPGAAMGNGFRHTARSSGSVSENEGDMPLSPKTPISMDDTSVELGGSITSLPAPPSQPPSYRTLVHNLIASNEPEKLSQIDRVMEKYAGREEELIKKLDLRYRRRRAKRERILEDLKSVEMSKSKENKEPKVEEPQMEVPEVVELAQEEKEGEDDAADKPLDHKKIEDMTSPDRIQFIKVEEGTPKDRSALMAMQSWDKSEERDWDREGKEGEDDEIGLPPVITKRPLPAAISDSSRTDVRANNVNLEGEDDDNSGFIGIPKVPKADGNVENLGNQVMKERLMRGRQREEQILRATGSPKESRDENKKLTIDAPPESPTFHDDYKLKPTNSYGDGISVITMETKATMGQNRATTGQQRVGDGEAVYSFDDVMKRPPNSITVEDTSGSAKQQPHASRDASAEGLPPKIQRVVPEMGTKEEKEQAVEASAVVAAKIDDVAARIEAQRKLREEEEAKMSQQGGVLMMADDEMPADEAKEDDTIDATMKTVDVEDEHVKVDAAANPVIIESILSSFDEEDHEPQQQQQRDFQKKVSDVEEGQGPSVDNAERLDELGGIQRQREIQSTTTGSGSGSENLEEEIARLIAEKESRFQAEKAVALMKAQRELEAERRARLEAEAARLKAERELTQLKVGEVASDELAQEVPSVDQIEADLDEAPLPGDDEQDELEPDTSGEMAITKEEDTKGAVLAMEPSPPVDSNTRMEAEFARLKAEQELERLKLEKMAEEAEAARIKAEEELEKLRTERAAKEAEASELVDAVLHSRAAMLTPREDEPSLDQGREGEAIDQSTLEVPSLGQGREGEVVDQTRLEAQAARIKAEQELERLKLVRAEAAQNDEQEAEDDLERMKSDQDEVENFRRGYSSEEEEDVVDDMQQKLREESETTADIESETEKPPHTPKADANNAAVADEGVAVEEKEETPEEVDAAKSQEPETEDEKNAEKITPPRSDEDEHDIPAAIEDETMSPSESPAVVQGEGEEEGDAQIHHIARITFEGDQSKGQLSFTTGSKVEAHSNQRGPWWLGRCGGRTGWFPASAVVPASEYFNSVVNSPVSDVVDHDKEEEVAQLSGDELNKVYDLIRNPSDPLEQEEENDDSDDESSPAKMRWLGGGKKNKSDPRSRDYSPPPDRLDPSNMAGLTQKLYSDDDSHSDRDDIARRPPSPILNGEDKLKSRPGESLEQSQDDDETPSNVLSKAQSEAGGKSKAEITATPTSPASIKKSTKKESQANTARPTPGWRAAKDPKSGLIYYFHTETRETTWKRPHGYKSRKASVNAASRTAGSKDKSKAGGKGILGFLTKRKKPRPEADSKANIATKEGETEAKANSVTKEGTASPKTTDAVGKLSVETKPQAQASVETKPQAQASQPLTPKSEAGAKSPPKSESPKKVAEAVTPKTDDSALAGSGSEHKVGDETPDEKDFWKSLDDSSSASDESEHSESTEQSETSLFSKTKMAVGVVGKLAGMLTEKLTTQDLPYGTLNDSAEQPQDMDSQADYQQKGTVEPATEGEEPQAELHSKKAISRRVEKPKMKEPAVVAAEEPKTPWRSAIDAASGRTYYYRKGSHKVTWEKPQDLMS